ncbi:MAG: hypothetical protein COS82_03890 [Zetaproteobacteria bacterium CG06_land_8_20_14_3_00_59_53]|nr:MAG: hypothetical protein AUK36_08670 [Zetaproteobacteria bacterium CG2_30_59_37]PIO89127.1 MAG: hypothetical protein COX56_09270 [Zetaproteobacteria bacterium CG23_combo_of_CG06-09_8_20_14_all_59_86]PIQ64440.1 MAG: hypothetical protein COV97_09080 [Zetaproteobacteria bacterium CG11_big_fil_rev_8_21_14_0_20_59_439]PIU70866.1 MAG: hypothetical protein COS82_03890 [Zetaproteobacteria bacterium CG06_land_8_20_14_3_00_59_53]PIU96303.1 MAG: hypothetical protein COS62_09460 [Zetaproteobacteria bac
MSILLRKVADFWRPLTLLMLTLITALSLWPLEHLPAAPGSDKLHHGVAYAALMFPAALRRPACRPWLAMFFLCWSGAIELIQPYVNRYGEWGDMAANASGLLLGLMLGAAARAAIPSARFS